MKKILLLSLFCLKIALALGQLPNVNAQWQFGMFGNELGEHLMEVIDIDNDGKNEVICSAVSGGDSWNGKEYFYILEYDNNKNTYAFEWISRLFETRISATQFKDLNNDQFLDIIIALQNGHVHIFDGKNRKEVKSLDFGLETINDLLIFDVDNDNQDELVACNNDTTVIYGLNLVKEMEIPMGGSYLQIGNIDTDDNIELVYSSGNIIELTDESYQQQSTFEIYRYSTPFHLVDANQDGIMELVYLTNYDNMVCYNFETNHTFWTLDPNSSVESVKVYDNPLNGLRELYFGTTYDGVMVYNAANGQLIRATHRHHEGVNNMAIGDANNDGQLELVWADGGHCTCEDYLFVYDFDSFTEEWRNFPLNSPFISVVYGDVDNDGEMEYVVAAQSSGSHEGGVINVFNAQDGTLEWRSEAYRYDVSSLKIADINNDGINQLIVGIEFTGYVVPATRLYIYNTSSYTVDHIIELRGSRRTRDIEVADINGDSNNEIIIGTGSGWSSDESFVYILSGQSHSILWQSEKIGRWNSYAYSLEIDNIDNDDALEIVGIEYDHNNDKKGIFIIDGKDYTVLKEDQFNYCSLTTGDYDGDNQLDIIAGTDEGEIVVLNALNLEPSYYMDLESSKIESVGLIKETNDDNSILYSNGTQLKLLNSSRTATTWESDTINGRLGYFNNMCTINRGSSELNEVLIGSDHGIFLFNFNHEEVQVGKYPWRDEMIGILNTPHSDIAQVKISPNPCLEHANISFKTAIAAPAQIEFFSLMGQKIKSHYFLTQTGENQVQINTQGWPQGTYIIKVQQNDVFIANGKLFKINTP
ncbi:FG-GAP-like repeat-containing protein [Carboxylicivirga sp. M1479]|uniref:FG-GAP-like repeat-containing protein n=1 Tax=Carboxylicivirga sp. M1479 TaxID=2594476 RepID=UPI00163DD6DD|nr:FG-GAP-like repeat-containing protein [Carboxylicivirga sp. M1479]